MPPEASPFAYGPVPSRAFQPPEELIGVVTNRVRALRERGEAIDYLTFVPDGEPTLDRHLEGELATETMLVAGVNDTGAAIEGVAAFLQRLGPRGAYLAVPARPPADTWVHPPTEGAVNRAFQCLAARLPRVELLTEFEGTAFGSAGDPAEDLLATATVHPMREDAARALLDRAGSGREILERLVAEGRLRPVRYRDHTFYVRPLAAPREGSAP